MWIGQIDEKNNFKTNNNIEIKVENALRKINKIVERNLNIPNIATIYRNKIFELDEQF